MTDKEVQRILESQKWQVAKTMPDTPHAYTVMRWWSDKGLFREIAHHIRDNGYTEYFYSRPFIYFEAGDYKYWHMDKDSNVTTLINRAKKELKYS